LGFIICGLSHATAQSKQNKNWQGFFFKTLPHDFAGWKSSFCTLIQSFTSQRHIYTRGISRVTWVFLTTWVAFYSLVIYPQILTTNVKFSYISNFKNIFYSWNVVIKFSLLKKSHCKEFSSIVAEHHSLLIYLIEKIGHQIHFTDKDNFVAKISWFYSIAIATVTLSKPSSKYSIDVRYCHQV
jgi:hypothetical protein